jgi:hypothetical protein
LSDWAADEGLHSGEQILSKADARFQRLSCTYGPYFFSDLDDTSESDEQTAIDTGQIEATGIRYIGSMPPDRASW